MNKRIIFGLYFACFFVLSVHHISAANCGGVVACACGDTVTSSYTLASNLTCSNNGLTIGAHNITIDGASYTITGNGTSGTAITNSGGWDGVTIKNISITGFGRGITLMGSQDSSILNNSIYSNVNSAISITNSPSNIISGNTTNGNSGNGITITSSASTTISQNISNSNNIGINVTISNLTTLTNNTANLNSDFGISIRDSSQNIVTGNTMSGNTYNFYYTHILSSGYNSNISTTNLVEGKPLYFLYNQSDTIYDGSITDIGMFTCVSCTNVTLQNATLSPHNYFGVFINNSSGTRITNVASNLDRYGMYLSSTTSSVLTNNVVTSSNYGFSLISSAGSQLIGNVVSKIANGYMDDRYTSNTFQNNQFLYNATSTMLTFSETSTPGIKNVGDTVTFTVTAKKPNGATCPNCTTITLYPSETSFTYTDNGSGVVTGSFIPTKSGVYSIAVVVTDPDNNIAKRNFSFFTGPSTTETTRYYLHNRNPLHNQPASSDTKSMLLTLPSSTTDWMCASWIQNSIDEIPNYPLSFISSINTSTWYNQYNDTGAYIGPQRYVSYDPAVNYSSSIDAVFDYTLANKNFTSLDWTIDHPTNWYWLTIKQAGGEPYWATFPSGESASNASQADVVRSYVTAPGIKSISNDNIFVLSATASSTATTTASIVVENTIASATSTTMVLSNISRPFINTTSTIDAIGTTTLSTTVSASATTSLDSIPMDITPSASSVDVVITSWTTDNKQWTESSSDHTVTTAHTIGDLIPGASYNIKIDSAVYNTCTADANGNISFTYTGGYSTHTFLLEKVVVQDTPAPSIPIGNGPPVGLIPQPKAVESTPTTVSPIQTPTADETNDQDTYILLLQQITLLQKQIDEMTHKQTFTKNLQLGQTDSEVILLQKMLRDAGFFTYPSITDYFGYQTYKALKAFQKSHKISPVSGYFGPVTRKLVEEE